MAEGNKSLTVSLRYEVEGNAADTLRDIAKAWEEVEQAAQRAEAATIRYNGAASQTPAPPKGSATSNQPPQTNVTPTGTGGAASQTQLATSNDVMVLGDRMEAAIDRMSNRITQALGQSNSSSSASGGTGGTGGAAGTGGRRAPNTNNQQGGGSATTRPPRTNTQARATRKRWRARQQRNRSNQQRAANKQAKAQARQQAAQQRAQNKANKQQLIPSGGSGSKRRGGRTKGHPSGANALAHPRNAMLNMLGLGGTATATALMANYITREVAKTGSQMGNIYNNVDMSPSQKRQGIAESIPIIGGTIKALREFGETIEGTAERMRRLSWTVESVRATNAARLGLQQEARGIEAERDTAQARAVALRDTRLAPQQDIDRSTYLGNIDYQNYQLLQPKQDALVMARAESDAATVARQSSEGRHEVIEQRRERMLARREALEQERAGILARESEGSAGVITGVMGHAIPGIQVGSNLSSMIPGLQGGPNERGARDKVDADLEQINHSLQTIEQQRAASSRDVAQNKEREATASGRTRQASLDILQAEFQIAKARSEGLRSQNVALGGMSATEREMSTIAAEMLHRDPRLLQFGDIREQAARVAGPWVERMQNTFGESTPEAARLRAIGAREEGTVRQADTVASDLQGRIREGTRDVQVEVSRRIAAAFRDLLRIFTENIEERVSDLERQIQSSQRRRQTQGGT